MSQHTSFLAVVPARAGSKRLPNKNTLELYGKPLISWTIEAALQSTLVDEVIVTSDDSKVIRIANEYGPLAPFTRPEYLSGDTATSIDVIKHVLEWCSKTGKHVENIVLLQPTSPLRTAQHVDEAIKYMGEKSADAVVSVVEADHSPLWMNTLPNDMDMSQFINESFKNKRSQDLAKFYRLNGAIYICNVEKLLEQETLFLDNNIYAFEMRKAHSVDIDTAFDFALCECILQKVGNK